MLADWSLWRTARPVVAVLVLIAASYSLVVAFDNITNPTGPAGNRPFVQGVMGMDGVPADDGFDWRAVESEPVHAVFSVGIMLGEAASGLLLLVGGIAGLRATAGARAWPATQRASLLGCALGLVVFWFGFIVVDGNRWIMFLNPQWNGIEPAFQNATLTFLDAAGHPARRRGRREARGVSCSRPRFERLRIQDSGLPVLAPHASRLSPSGGSGSPGIGGGLRTWATKPSLSGIPEAAILAAASSRS